MKVRCRVPARSLVSPVRSGLEPERRGLLSLGDGRRCARLGVWMLSEAMHQYRTGEWRRLTRSERAVWGKRLFVEMGLLDPTTPVDESNYWYRWRVRSLEWATDGSPSTGPPTTRPGHGFASWPAFGFFSDLDLPPPLAGRVHSRLCEQVVRSREEGRRTRRSVVSSRMGCSDAPAVPSEQSCGCVAVLSASEVRSDDSLANRLVAAGLGVLGEGNRKRSCPTIQEGGQDRGTRRPGNLRRPLRSMVTRTETGG